MIAIASRFIERAAFFALAAVLFVGLASCGSGAVGGNPPANACGTGTPCTLTILPGDGTIMYSGQPTTFALSGGTGQFIVTSSNQSILPTGGATQNATSITLVPNQVTADTTVTISVRDTGSAPVATASVTVKPGTINNDIQITASSTQGCSAGTVCSGGDALVTVTLSQAGIALANRQVRFDAISGDFRFITSPTGTSPETLSTTALVNTDESGRASIRIRVNADAPNQTAILQATDVVSGASRRASFLIAQSTGSSPGFFATPSSYTFQGPNQNSCASIASNASLSATFFIFGGLPPYTITSPSSGLVVSRDTVSFSGGSFDVKPNGVCLSNVPISIRDTSGHTTTVAVSNILGTAAVPALAVSPDQVTLTTCSSSAVVTAVGGTGNYVGSSGSDALLVSPGSGGFFQIRRNATGTPPPTTPISVGISDGVTTQTVTVTLTGQAADVCPPPPLSVSPNSVTLTNCTAAIPVNLRGGTGSYSASANSTSIRLRLANNVLTVSRNSGPVTAGGAATVTVSDGLSSTNFVVTDTAGTCP